MNSFPELVSGAGFWGWFLVVSGTRIRPAAVPRRDSGTGHAPILFVVQKPAPETSPRNVDNNGILMTSSRLTSLTFSIALTAVAVLVAPASAEGHGTGDTPGALARGGYGAAVAVGENEVFVGESQNSLSPGYVYIYRKANGVWAEHARLQATDGKAGDGFGSSIAIDGARMVVGAMREPHGAAYVFERDASGEWQERARLAPENPSGVTVFGMAVALSGDRILVGAPATNQAGVVHAYQRGTDGSWTHAGEIPSTSAPGSQNFFGTVIRANGDDALIASSGGAVSAFRWDGQTWTATGQLPVPGQAGGGLARPIALANGQAFVTEVAGNAGTGAVHVFARARDGAWTHRGWHPHRPTRRCSAWSCQVLCG